MNYINMIAESLDDLDYNGPEEGQEFEEAIELPELRLPDGKLQLTKYGGERTRYGDGHIVARLIRPGVQSNTHKGGISMIKYGVIGMI